MLPHLQSPKVPGKRLWNRVHLQRTARILLRIRETRQGRTGSRLGSISLLEVKNHGVLNFNKTYLWRTWWTRRWPLRFCRQRSELWLPGPFGFISGLSVINTYQCNLESEDSWVNQWEKHCTAAIHSYQKSGVLETFIDGVASPDHDCLVFRGEWRVAARS